VIAGTLRADRQPVREPSPTGQLGDAPGYFNEQQRVIWNAARDAAPPGLLTACDRTIIEGYSLLAYAREKLAKAWNVAGAEPLVRSQDKDSKGRLVVSAHLREIRRLTEQLRLIETELGFTPASRSRIDLGEAPVGERLAKYLA
jgi:phage terminase small subunit